MESARSWFRFGVVVLILWFVARQGLYTVNRFPETSDGMLYRKPPSKVQRLLGYLVGASQEVALRPGSEIYPLGNVSIPRHEASGICRSSTPGVYWIHNDSGDSPRIYAIREKGELVSGPSGIAIEGARNRDWEDIRCVNGTLYIADTGNNLNWRSDQCLYAVPEPKPDATSAKVEKTIPLAFPGAGSAWRTWDRDCESFFCLGGKFWFLTKERWPFQLDAPRPGTTLFCLDPATGSMTAQGRRDLDGWATSADVSPDGRTLAVLVEKPVQSVWLFPIQEGAPQFEGEARRFVFSNAGRAEGLCFRDNQSLLILNEEGFLFTVAMESDGFHAVKKVTENNPSPR